ncbi:very-long-chain 3-oxoacyl-CoA reductase-like isoform X2 [Anneissia japonica]|uniref:very-long-chain 3-oxoacyl-CoA reductase-like isoform X2 n=1 Tax=Anneissia japonica TaxID=1529436 RepID=UPI0014258B45|nr:very-long-chain 3-oxoacyl-CoA reductase-like isoform X2 [Anneissia japonica]
MLLLRNAATVLNDSTNMTTNDILAILGFLTTCWLTLKFCRSLFRWVFTHCVAAKLGLSADLLSYGEWAVVTGATNGIGKAYAEQLAEMGLNIVLISRSTNKLEKVASEIEKAYNVKTKIITVDFTKVEGIYEDIESRLDGLEVGVLVNNVGMMNLVSKLLEIPDTKKMTQICLPQMIQRKKGAILNISSVAGLKPFPYISVYSSTKAYMDFFSHGIHYEYRDTGVIIQSVTPFIVKTNMSVKASWFSPEASTYVRGALKTVGVVTRTCGFISHSLLVYIAACFPAELLARFLQFGLNKVREDILEQRKEEAKEKEIKK